MYSCMLSSLLRLRLTPGFWMSDKPLVQQALASELAELIVSVKSSSISFQYVEGFWNCLMREWNGIDRLRYVLTIRSGMGIELFIAWTNFTCSSEDL
jgi:hypothetical protein